MLGEKVMGEVLVVIEQSGTMQTSKGFYRHFAQHKCPSATQKQMPSSQVQRAAAGAAMD